MELIKKHGALFLIGFAVLLAIVVLVTGAIRENSLENGAFDFANFTTRPIAEITESTPHGEISVRYLEYINDTFFNRFGASFQELATAQWIAEELLSMGYDFDDIEIQEFTLGQALDVNNPIADLIAAEGTIGLLYILDGTPFVNLDLRFSQLSQNVILTVPGQSQCDTFIVVGAHYDSVMFPGASDNASGTALLLESAQRMRYLDNYYTIVYVFFGSEEIGILGAFYYVDSLSLEEHENLLFMINADILIEGTDLFYMAGSYDGNEHMPAANHITETWDAIAQRLNSEHGFELIAYPQGAFGPSDQLAFIHSYLFAPGVYHTVMFLSGLNAVPNMHDMYITAIMSYLGRVLHTAQDDFHYINENWPGKIESNMRAFSIFLEELLLASYS